MLLVSGATTTMERLRGEPGLGRFVTPASRNSADVVAGWSWAADNGAFGGFDEDAFLAMIDRFQAHKASCLFAVAPDCVGDAAATDRLWRQWGAWLRWDGWPAAYVAQNGATEASIPWDEFETLFIGGDTPFKLASRPLMEAAKERGKWVHVGRVNSLRRLRWAHEAGADSVDGTQFSMYPDTYIERALRFMEGLAAQGPLEGVA